MSKLIFLSLLFLTSIAFALKDDAEQQIEIDANSVTVDEISGFNEFLGNAEVRQGSLFLSAELIQVQTNSDGVETMVARGSIAKPAMYTQIQESQTRLIEATATLITYDVNKGVIF